MEVRHHPHVDPDIHSGEEFQRIFFGISLCKELTFHLMIKR